VVVDVVEHDGADHGREPDGDFVEGDDDSLVGGLGDLVAGHPEDLVLGHCSGPGEQQQEEAGDSAVAIDRCVVEQRLDAPSAGFVGHGDLGKRVGA
jgi:hypothetical protein